MTESHIKISWYPRSPVAPIYRYGYRVGTIKRDDQGAAFLTLHYRGKVLERPVASLSPAHIHSIVEMFCAGCDGILGALTWHDVPPEMMGRRA